MMKKRYDIEKDPYFKRIGKEHSVEHEDLIIAQAGNCHIHVYDKTEGRMVSHINCTKMLTDDEMVDLVVKLFGVVKKHEKV
jgi:phosphoribosylaminoimidazole carboxylase (NCAIR synthetase)